jgi:hypothetical protein
MSGGVSHRIASHRIASTTSHPCTNSRPSHPSIASVHRIRPSHPPNSYAGNPPCFQSPRPRPRPRPPSKHQWRAQKPQPKTPSGLPSRGRRLPSSRTLIRVRTAQTAQTVQCNAMPLCCHALTSAPSTIDIRQYTIRQVQYACVASEQTRTHALTPFRGVPSWLVRLTADDRRPTTDD